MTDQQLTALFQEARTIAVVGMSNHPGRASFGVSRFLVRQGFRVIPVNPNHSEILGETCYPTVRDIPQTVDIVDIFRRSEFVAELMPDVIALRPRLIWLQEGVSSPRAASMAEAAGIPLVMDKCILKELARLLPRF